MVLTNMVTESPGRSEPGGRDQMGRQERGELRVFVGKGGRNASAKVVCGLESPQLSFQKQGEPCLLFTGLVWCHS